jgi:hypothetical protein
MNSEDTTPLCDEVTSEEDFELDIRVNTQFEEHESLSITAIIIRTMACTAPALSQNE